MLKKTTKYHLYTKYLGWYWLKHRRLPHWAQPSGFFDKLYLFLQISKARQKLWIGWVTQLTIFCFINLVPSMEKDKSFFSSHDKWSLSSFERYEHHNTVVSLGQLDGMWCKDPLIEADLPATKQSCSLPTQRDKHTKFGGQIKSPWCDFAKNVIVLLWVYDLGHKDRKSVV